MAFAVAGRLLGGIALKSASVAPPPDNRTPYLCNGSLKDDPIFAGQGWRFDVALEECAEGLKGELKPAKGNIRLFSPELTETLEIGDKIRFLARFKRPHSFKNPGSFNYPLYLLTQDIGATGSLVGPRWIVKIGKEELGLSTRLILRARNSINLAIGKLTDGDAAGLLKAITIGRRDGISSETRDAFARTGLAHLLAISGLHVGYVAAIIFIIVRFLLGWWPRLSLRWPMQKIAALVSLPAVWFYVAVAHFPVSAIRAAIMLTVFLISLFFLWRRDLLSALATAVFAILIILPSSVFSVSFQLSVVSVFAIIVLTPIIMEKFRRWPKPHLLLEIIAVTLAATLGSAPLVALNFHFVSAIGLFANIVAVPFTGFILMPLAIVASIFSIIFIPSGVWFWKAAQIAAGMFLKMVLFFNHHASSLVISWAPSNIEVILAYATIALIIFWGRLHYKKFLAAALAALLIIDIGYWHIRPLMSDELEITFLDVGHGDSIVVHFPNNHVMLVDGGGIKGSDFDIGRNVILPALLRMGIHHIDEIILTHPHHDHYKGLAAIAENFKPRVLYTNGTQAPEDESADWEGFLTRVRNSGVPIEVVPPNFSLEEGSVNISIFAPTKNELATLDPNDSSLVTKLSYKNKKILLTGDLMKVGEQTLLNAGVDISSDVLKVAHHGSESSSSEKFLNAVRPQIAVITVGADNQYGVPDQIVLDRLNQIGAKIYRTDLSGAVTIKTDGNNL